MKKPSGRVGWGIIEYDLWLIESGFSPPVRLAPMLASRDSAAIEKLYDDAEDLAKNRKLGIWQFPAFAGAIADTARRDSDPPPLVLREFDDATLLKISERLLGSGDGDNDICAAFSSGLREITRDLKPATRSCSFRPTRSCVSCTQACLFGATYWKRLRSSETKVRSTLSFLESVAAGGSDRDLQQIARDAASRIRPAQ